MKRGFSYGTQHFFKPGVPLKHPGLLLLLAASGQK